jgi:hypothetical protein
VLLKLYPHAVRVSCGQARVSAAYVRDMLPFPVTAETSMTWCLVWMLAARLRLCLVPQKKHCANKRLSVTSNLRYMHGVLNLDEIKN